MQFFYRFIFLVFCVMSGLPANAQVGIAIEKALEKGIPPAPILTIPTAPTTPPKTPPFLSSVLGAPSVPKVYHYDHLGLFCKIEVQLEKKIQLPMKVRLGEVQYTEWLEYDGVSK